MVPSECGSWLSIEREIGTGLYHVDQKKFNGEEMARSIDCSDLWDHHQAKNLPPRP
jgi:hypothetical protein